MSACKNIMKLYVSFRCAPIQQIISRQISQCVQSTHRNRCVMLWQHQKKINSRCTCPVYSNIHTNVDTAEEESILSRMKKRLGFGKKLKFSKSHLNVSGTKLYAFYTKQINATEIMKELELPDTFNSWFLVTELHMWFLICKLSTLGEDGKYVRMGLIQTLWKDIDFKTKSIKGFALSSKRKDAMNHFYSHFINAGLSYNEAILNDDRVLAATVWRILFEKEETDAEKLARVVEYIRKQIKHLEDQESDVLLANGILQLLPFFEDRKPYDFSNKFANQPHS